MITEGDARVRKALCRIVYGDTAYD
jgi:hypothetical protein